MSRLVGLFAYLLQFIASIHCQGYYSVIAPSTLRPNSEYHVAVSVHQSSEPSTIKVGIISSTYSDFKTVEVRSFWTELIKFELADLKPDKYSLTAEGISGVIFTNETALRFQQKQFSVLVQTDKSIYKPGDVVRYRALVLDSNMKPATSYGKVEIIIKDGNQNRIKHITDVQLVKSVYTDEFQLSTFPVLGQWTINVEVMGENYKKDFEVAEYILPKFDVSIESADHAVYKDGKISATVRAKHHFGKPIKGEATLSIYPKFYGSIQPFIFDLITRKVVPIDGKAFIEFDIKEELKFKEDYQRDIFLEAIVEENLTGRKQNVTKIVTIHRDRYNIETIRRPQYYVPGIPFEVVIKVVQHDGTPIKDPSNPIVAYLTKSYGSDEVHNKTEYKLDSTGMAKLRFIVPEDDTEDHHSIIVSYLDVATDIGSIARKRQHSNRYIQADILTDNPTVNQEVTVAVKSNQKMTYFFCQIVGRGDILLSQAVQVPDSTYHVFTFVANFAMVPKAKLLVYFVSDGEFIFDEQTIDFGDELWNYIKIEAPPRTFQGQDVDITITTKPYSYIGLMAVDQNAVSLRTGNDLTHSSVLEELSKYDSENARLSPMGSPGHESGVITLTNSDYFIERAPPTKASSTFSPEEDDDDGKMTTVKKTDIGPAHKFEVNTRPPLAGPYAFSRIPKPFWNRPRVHVMHDIMDTWLFMNISSGKDGRTTIHRKAPEGMSSWVITGFSLDPITGLGLSKTPRKIQLFQPFYITTDLPYSIKIGEVISIPFVVFNNLDRDVDVKVTLYNNAQDFDFPKVDNEIDETPKIELYSRQTINIPTNSAQSLSFIIRPKKIGPIEIMATASSPTAADTIKRTLLVQPEGVTEYVNKGILVDLNSKSEQRENIKIDIPRNVVPDSTHIEVSVVGDILGPAVLHLEDLIRLPYGCGEQNMAHFVPNVLILKYLQKTNQLSPAIEVKARKYLDVGYQRQLTYKHKDGSFSAFGNSDKNSSTWLTAYVARSFRQAVDYTEVDEEIIKAALEYLAKIQAPNGSFPEMGTSPVNHYTSDNDRDAAITAFCLLAFLEDINHIPDYRSTINRALDFIVRSLDSTEDIFALAIGTYALQIADHNAKDVFIQKLDSKSRNEDGKKWWTLSVPDTETKSPWYNKSRTLNIEVTSYAALALLESNLVSDALPILKWLVDQRNINGGFSASLDTVVGLQTLIKFAEKISTVGNNIQVVFTYSQDDEYRINVHPENALAVLSKEISPETRQVTVSASGRGMALAQISYRYNTNVTGAWPRFTLDPQVNRISHADYLHLSICTSFVPAASGPYESNMAVMEISLPSGFTVDLDTLPSLEANERIKKVETKNRDTVVIIYFDFLNRTEICPTIDAHKTHKVAKQKPTSVIIYDYYDNARRARLFYYAPKSTLCDICEGVTCGNSCAVRAQERQSLNGEDDGFGGSANSGSAVWTLTYFLLIPVICTRTA